VALYRSGTESVRLHRAALKRSKLKHHSRPIAYRSAELKVTANHSPFFRNEPGMSGYRRSHAAVLQNVFDKQGRLIRNYSATEHTDNSWDVMELIRVTSDCAIAAHIR
jgi:hypothetical protein